MANNKPFIDGIIVVEGKTDKDKILKLFNANVITTNGSALNNELFNTIIELAKKNKIILFLDPDYVGEQIRKKIVEAVNINNFYHCFIDINKINPKSTKKGIAEAEDKDIIEALSNIVEFKINNNSLSINEFHDLDLTSKNKRLWLCEKLNISYCNYKQLYKRLNMLNLSFNELKKILKEYE